MEIKSLNIYNYWKDQHEDIQSILIYSCVYTYIYIYIYVCMCVFIYTSSLYMNVSMILSLQDLYYHRCVEPCDVKALFSYGILQFLNYNYLMAWDGISRLRP